MTMNKQHILAFATVGLFACGDNKAKPDASIHHDAPNPDGPSIPTPPVPGAQIDRLGRPAINTALNHAFDVSATAKGSAKDAYNQDSATGTWPTTYVAEFSKNLALLDFLDSGLLCSAGVCSGSAGKNGCGNQVLYNGQPGGGGSAMATSYATLATVLADDQLYLDTSKTVCAHFLSLEFDFVLQQATITCGGRAPSYDVIDTVLTAVAIGVGGFTTDGNYTPAFHDNVGVHTDIDDSTFPFLGTPHNN
jgi:hypothetical protein